MLTHFNLFAIYLLSVSLASLMPILGEHSGPTISRFTGVKALKYSLLNSIDAQNPNRVFSSYHVFT